MGWEEEEEEEEKERGEIENATIFRGLDLDF